MIRQLTLYTRRDCCLCEEMKAVVHAAAIEHGALLEEIDVDGSVALQERYGNEVPVLFIDGRKAFKYRVSKTALQRRLQTSRLGLLNKLRARRVL